MRWLDLSHYEVTLTLLQLPNQNGEQGPTILFANGGDKAPEKFEKLGFQRHNSGALLRTNPTISPSDLKDFQAEFPEAKTFDIPDAEFNSSVYYRDMNARQVSAPAPKVSASEAARQMTEGEVVISVVKGEDLKTLVQHSIKLGVNRLGQEVHQNEEGERFIIQGDTTAKMTAVFESKSAHINSGLFLRVKDPESLMACAEGFVEVMSRGIVQRFDDLKHYAATIYDTPIGDDDARLISLHNAIEASMTRWLSRKGGATMRDIYGGAMRLHEAHPYMTDLKRHADQRVVFALPQPVAVALQRALGTEEDLKGKKIVVSGAGNGSLIAQLSKTAILAVYENDNMNYQNIRGLLSATGRNLESVKKSDTDWTGSDYILANLSNENAVLNTPVIIDDFTSLYSSDLALAWTALQNRSDDGRAILILKEKNDQDGRAGEMERFLEEVDKRYAVEGITDIDGGLMGSLNEPKTRIIIVGNKRPVELELANKNHLKVDVTKDFASLWTWTSNVVATRSRIADDFARITEENQDILNEETLDRTLAVNRFQAPYVALSALGQASTMVPRNLEGATRDAQATLAKAHPDFDQWVANELFMTKDQLAKSFSPEQVDSIGLAIFAEERGRGFLIADQMGIGKGRQLAALMRRAAMMGKKVLFLTERGTNLSDIARDIRDIDSDNEFSTMILNSQVEIIDSDTEEVVMRSTDKDEVSEIMLSGEWPADYNLILATYSQFNRPGELTNSKRRKTELEANRRRHALAVQAALPVEGEENPEVALPAPVAEPELDENAIPSGIAPKSWWLRHAIDKDTVIFADECHNAASDESNIGSNILQAVNAASGTVYSSATFAKNAKNMTMYGSLFPKDFDKSNLTEIINKGGESMQETLTAMLVKDGVMVTRQHDLSKCDFEVVFDDENEDRNRAYMAKLAPVLAEMAYLSGDMDKHLSVLNQGIEAELLRRLRGNEGQVRRRMKSLQMNRISFGSPLYNLTRLFVASMLVEKASAEAIKELKAGRKPVILADNTIQAILKDLLETQEGNDDAQIPDFRNLMHRTLNQLTRVTRRAKRDQAQQEVEDVFKPADAEVVADTMAERIVALLPENILSGDARGAEIVENWKDVVRQAIATVADGLTLDHINADHVLIASTTLRELVDALPEEHREASSALRMLPNALHTTPYRSKKRIQQMIDALPDLPASAIDEIRNNIEAEGRRLFEAGEIETPWICGEITGRTLECRDGRIVAKKKSNKTIVKNDFNSGKIHALIINGAGATGIDLHASERFLDQSQRVMLELQQHADIMKQIQAIGRVNRTGQVIGPVIRTLVLKMAAHERLIAMRNTKLRRLSANIAASKENPASIEGIADLMNRIGDKVCYLYGQAHPDMMRRMGFDPNEREMQEDEHDLEGDMEHKDHIGFSNTFLARLVMLDPETQEQVMDELKAEFEVEVQELDAKGENPLKSRVVEGIVHLREKMVFDGAETDGLESEFYKPVYAQKISIEKTIDPIRGAVLAEEVEKGMVVMGGEDTNFQAQRLSRMRDGFLKIFLGREDNSVEEAIAAGKVAISNMATKLDKLIEVLPQLHPGVGIRMSVEGMPEDGVLTRVRIPHRSEQNKRAVNEFMASAYEVEIVVPGDIRPRYLSVQTLLNDKEFQISEGLHGAECDDTLARFDNALNGSRHEARVMLVGNAWLAMQHAVDHKLGNPVSFEVDGVRHTGILVTKKNEALDFLPVRMRTAEMATAALSDGGLKLYGTSEFSAGGVVITRQKNAQFRFILPHFGSAKYGNIYENEGVQQTIRVLNRQRDQFKAPELMIEAGNLQAILQVFMDAGVPFYTSSKNRTWVNEWLGQRHGRPEAVELPAEDLLIHEEEEVEDHNVLATHAR
jgi:hypothetical protein